MVRNASPEFLACMAAGVDMETVSVYKSVTNTWEITMKTVRPVGFVRNCHNEITSVVVQGG
jgi:hypothetical protein